MGVLNVPQPSFQQRRPGLVEQMLPSVLTMLLKRKLDASDTESSNLEAEAGLNEYRQKVFERDPKNFRPSVPSTEIPEAADNSALEKLLTPQFTPAEPAKKEAAGLPTPPETPAAPEAGGNFANLSSMLKVGDVDPGGRTEANRTELQKVLSGPAPADRPLPVPRGQSASVYGQQAYREMNPTLVEGEGGVLTQKAPGVPVAPKAPAIQMVPLAGGGYAGIEKKLGVQDTVTDESGVQRPLQINNPRLEAQIQRQGIDTVKVVDSTTNQLMSLSKTDFANKNAAEPGRYVESIGEYTKALGKKSFTEDVRANINGVRRALTDPAIIFDETQAAQLAYALGDIRMPHDQVGVMDKLKEYVALKSLTPAQVVYVVRIRNLAENAMSLRSLQMQGQGSEDQRAAIRSLLPTATTASRKMANEQLNQLEGTLSSVERGMIKANLNYPSFVTDNTGITAPGVINQQWTDVMHELDAKGYVFNPQTNDWHLKDDITQTPVASPVQQSPALTPQRPAATPTATGAQEQVVEWVRDQNGKLTRKVTR